MRQTLFFTSTIFTYLEYRKSRIGLEGTSERSGLSYLFDGRPSRWKPPRIVDLCYRLELQTVPGTDDPHQRPTEKFRCRTLLILTILPRTSASFTCINPCHTAGWLMSRTETNK